MPSSASTRSPRPDGRIRLLVDVVGDDHPRACTGRRLLHLGLAAVPGRGRGRPILLDPYADRPLSGGDAEIAYAGGVLVVDCSWNQLSRRHAFPSELGDPRTHGAPRRLPLLIAGNPQHYGRVGELNTVEAFAAALWILGASGDARRIAEGFAGGPSFLELNEARLEAYRSAASVHEVRDAERTLFGGAAAP